MGENFPNSAITFFFKWFIAFPSTRALWPHSPALCKHVSDPWRNSTFVSVTSQGGSRVKSIVLIIIITTKVPKAPSISSASPHIFFQLAVFLHRPVTVEQLWICGAMVNSILYLFFNLRWLFKYSCGEVTRHIDLPAITWHCWRGNQFGDRR